MIVEQLADAHKCAFCGGISAESNVRLTCTGDSSILTLTLLSQDDLPPGKHFLLRFANSTAIAELCSDISCPTVNSVATIIQEIRKITTLPRINTPMIDSPNNTPKDNTGLIVGVSVVIIIILFTQPVVFVAFLVLWRRW